MSEQGPPPDLSAQSPPKFEQECGLKIYALAAVWVTDDVVASPQIERPILELNVTVLWLLLNPKIKPEPRRKEASRGPLPREGEDGCGGVR